MEPFDTLLRVQERDTSIDQLRHRRDALPERASLAAKMEGVDREVARLEDFVSEGESLSAGTDEELRAAREEEERRRIGAADAASIEASVMPESLEAPPEPAELVPPAPPVDPVVFVAPPAACQCTGSGSASATVLRCC